MYDKAGNISEIYKNGLLTNRYTYDKLSRMVREDNKVLGMTTTYNYDTNGNILTKTVYSFTYGSLVEKMPVSITPYSYKATTWRDQMLAFKGEKCEYDAIGYPIKYRNHTTTFKYGGRMVSFDNNTYVYDASGERVSKTVNGIATKYITVSGKVIRSVSNQTVIDFFYDNYGLSAIKHNGVSYFVRKNVLGDVTHIYDISGNLCAQYVYDAWGNHKVLDANGLEDTNQASIGNTNPIRYRGYFYDVETKLYYLKTRYYDPETGRFISADDTQFLEPNTINGLNLYAYCGNNPVMNVDPSGRLFLSLIIAAVVSSVVSATTSVAVQLVTTGQVDWAQVGISALFGAASGVLGFTGIGGAVGQFIIQGALAVGEKYAIAGLHGEAGSMDFNDVLLTFLFAGASGAVGSIGAAKEFKRIKQMESSLIKYTMRDVKRYGEPLIKTFLQRGTKYIREFVRPFIRHTVASAVKSFVKDITLYWGKKSN